MGKSHITKQALGQLDKLAKFPMQLYRTKPKAFVTLLLTLILATTLVGLGLAGRSQASIDQPTLEVVKQLPFKPVLPAAKAVQWRKVSPPGTEPVFAYSSQLAGTDIIVSQQEAPRKLREDSQVKELADQFNATNTLKAGNFTTYIGRSAKGPQSVIFVKDEVLVLIKSKSTIKDSDWIRYVSSLKQVEATDPADIF